MDTSLALHWHYLVFFLPLGLAALFLLLSSFRLGHHPGHGHGGHGHGGHGHGGHSTTHSPAAAHTQAARSGGRHHKTASVPQGSLLWGRLGLNRAPLVMVLAAFCLAWGFCGYWANTLLLHTRTPGLAQVWPSLAIAIGGGLLGAFAAAAILARVLPREESSIVSRNNLFGLTGRVAFPVNTTAGRIHVYDEHGTLHDEMCRIAPNHPHIDRGRYALVLDMDEQGHLIVEEVSKPLA